MKTLPPKFKRIIKEETLRALKEATPDTVYRQRQHPETRRRERDRAAASSFFGEDDPLITKDEEAVDLPSSAMAPLDAEEDPNKTAVLDPVQLQRNIAADLGPEQLRGEADRLYTTLIEPFYSDRQLKRWVARAEEDIGRGNKDSPNIDIADALGQIIGWFHPAFHSRGKPTYDNPGPLGIEIAQEFEKEDRDIVGDAGEFINRLFARESGAAKEEFAQQHGGVRQQQQLEARRQAILRLTQEKNLPPPDTVRPALIKQYEEYVIKQAPEKYKDYYENYLAGETQR
jgi:hypothetical protein